MALNDRELEKLLELVALTREAEIDCDECLARVAEFAEKQLAGRPACARLEAVAHHLALCDECREEYEVLQRALEGLGGE